MQIQFQTHFGPILSLRGRFSSVFCVKFGLIARRSSQQWVENLSELDMYQIFCAPAILQYISLIIIQLQMFHEYLLKLRKH